MKYRELNKIRQLEKDDIFAICKRPTVKKVSVILFLIFTLGITLVNVIGTITSYEYLVEKLRILDDKMQKNNISPIKDTTNFNGISFYKINSDKNQKRKLQITLDGEIPSSIKDKMEGYKAEVVFPSLNLKDNSASYYCEVDKSQGQRFKVSVDLYSQDKSITECQKKNGKILKEVAIEGNSDQEKKGSTSSIIKTTTTKNSEPTINNEEKNHNYVDHDNNEDNMKINQENIGKEHEQDDYINIKNNDIKEELPLFETFMSLLSKEYLNSTDEIKKAELDGTYQLMFEYYIYENVEKSAKYSKFDFNNWSTFLPPDYFKNISKKGHELYKNKSLGIISSGSITDFKEVTALFYTVEKENNNFIFKTINYKDMKYSDNSLSLDNAYILRRLILPVLDKCFIIKGFTKDNLKYYNLKGERVNFMRCPNSWCNYKYKYFNEDQYSSLIKNTYFIDVPWPNDITLFNENTLVLEKKSVNNTIILGNSIYPRIKLDRVYQIGDYYIKTIDCNYPTFDTIEKLCNQQLECYFDHYSMIMHDQYFDPQTFKCEWPGSVESKDLRFSLFNQVDSTATDSYIDSVENYNELNL